MTDIFMVKILILLNHYLFLQVWSHFDGGGCPGQAMGVRVRLDNGIAGFIPTKMISDKHVSNPEERVKVS